MPSLFYEMSVESPSLLSHVQSTPRCAPDASERNHSACDAQVLVLEDDDGAKAPVLPRHSLSDSEAAAAVAQLSLQVQIFITAKGHCFYEVRHAHSHCCRLHSR
jgi:hypothetical protein